MYIEPPFSGEYDNFFKPGTFVCRKCDTHLYKSDNKFDAHCGWPAFDQEITGSVKRLLDPDGERTEIQCAKCDTHLGHVFEGEHFTATDTRHCVNSYSLKFVPQPKTITKMHSTAS
jgi:peptide-methionine (R)-S-oxide reductase